jgi:hypothetical protein
VHELLNAQDTVLCSYFAQRSGEQRWQPLEDGRWGRVVGREGAERQLGEAMMVVKGMFYVVVTRLLIWDRTGPFVLRP